MERIRAGRNLAVCVLAALVAAPACGGEAGYEVSFVFPSAPNLIKSSAARVAGTKVGEVTGLEVRDGQAVVRVSVDDDHAPLPSGSTARIAYTSLAGMRYVDITPGEEGAAPLPDGALVTGNPERVELNDVLNTLDPETRAALVRVLPALDSALAGREEATNATLAELGPAVDALGTVLASLGKDAPALRTLVTSVRDLAARLNDKREPVREALTGLETTLAAVAGREETLKRALAGLPPVLTRADSALGRVPATAAAAVPLLEEARPVVEALPGVAADLRPLVDDLGPVLAELRPTLVALDEVLVVAPALLDRLHGTLPPVTSALAALAPALDFLRPYTPELAGAAANAASATASYDVNGHYIRILGSSGSALVSPEPGPGKLSPFLRQNRHRQPGELEDGPATDAAGSPLR